MNKDHLHVFSIQDERFPRVCLSVVSLCSLLLMHSNILIHFPAAAKEADELKQRGGGNSPQAEESSLNET